MDTCCSMTRCLTNAKRESIELVRRQYSGAEHRVIRGIGLISCIYVNRITGQFWVIDYRLYEPDGDGKSKLDHVQEMLKGAVYAKAKRVYHGADG